MKVSIVIPAYNEERRIGRTLEVYSSYFESLRQRHILDYEILIVINNTRDKTEEIVNKYKRDNKRIIYKNLIKGGKGYAVVEGFKDALKRDNDLIGFVDADMATPPEAFYDLIRKINGYKGVLASRYVKRSKITPKFTFRRLIVSRIFNFIVRSLFLIPFRDTQCGAKLFKREAIEYVIPKLGMTQWAFDIELLYELHKEGYAIIEIPTTWREIEGSKLKVAKTSFQMFFSSIQLRIIKSPFKKLLQPSKYPVIWLWKSIK